MNSAQIDRVYTELSECIARVGEAKTHLFLATLALDLLSQQADAETAVEHILNAERLANI
ncbi:MAG: hypothetical protein ABJC66_08275 [Gammaproteobacteria bacterium]